MIVLESTGNDKSGWMFMPSSFGTWLEGKRKAAKVTQTELGEVIGVSRQQIGRIESGEQTTKNYNVVLMCRYLDADVDEGLRLLVQSQSGEESDTAFTVSVDSEIEPDPMIHRVALEAARKAAQTTASHAYQATVDAIREGFTAVLTPEEFKDIRSRLVDTRPIHHRKSGIPSVISDPAT